MTKQQQALRLAALFLRAQAMGRQVTPEECKQISDLCFINLPMKYRLSKDEIKALRQENEQHLV